MTHQNHASHTCYRRHMWKSRKHGSHGCNFLREEPLETEGNVSRREKKRGESKTEANPRRDVSTKSGMILLLGPLLLSSLLFVVPLHLHANIFGGVVAVHLHQLGHCVNGTRGGLSKSCCYPVSKNMSFQQIVQLGGQRVEYSMLSGCQILLEPWDTWYISQTSLQIHYKISKYRVWKITVQLAKYPRYRTVSSVRVFSAELKNF